ncbi:2-hydroxyacid dehydrogenase [Massilia niastensis]|uniref:2-hydroxyacid dehydrogenase n=1 Tax=Massilia niastensis TaxID=544911 RepID=UPI000374CF58|nr:glyoxylate/hydroxypyruvate reductase A [Massilia niastensis]
MTAEVFLYKADPVRGAEWAALFREKAPQLAFAQWPYRGDPARVRYLAAWVPPADLSCFPNLEVLFSVGAGIDQFDLSTIPPRVALARMVEPGIVKGMVEYVTLAVLSLHREWLTYRDQQRAAQWQALRVHPARSRRIGVMGLGVLAQAVLGQLRGLGFPCAGWSRSSHTLEGVECYAGADALPAFLARTDVLICLLPLTNDTRGILDRRLFSLLPRGAALVNCGRGPHLDQEALLEALDAQQLSSAILDVCEPEPLPADHPFWRHPQIMLTPHIASMTQPETAVDVILDNIERHRTGQVLTGLVDRARGY